MNARMFEGFDAAQYEEEARQRWGHSPQFQESQRRWSSYTKQDMAEIQRESQEIMARLVAVSDRDPADPQVQEAIARHHRQINDRFFTCPPDIYRQIATGYVEDPRFKAFYENYKPGMAAFLRDAIHAYCDAMAKT